MVKIVVKTQNIEIQGLKKLVFMRFFGQCHESGTINPITLNDPRWPSSEGWVKMQQIVPTSQGNINIHYVYNQTLKIFDDFKFKP